VFDLWEVVQGVGPDDEALMPSNDAGAAVPAGSSITGGKYVPPSMRGAGRGAGETMGRGPGGSHEYH
jgi:translation initiation factor 3 subunit G